MTKTLERLAREEIKKLIKLLNEGQLNLFRRLHTNSGDDIFDGTIENCIDNIPVEKLDNVIRLLENTIEKRNQNNKQKTNILYK